MKARIRHKDRSARVTHGATTLWAPTDVGADLALWLDAWDSPFQTRTDVNGNERVEVWSDLSANGNDAAQTSASNQAFREPGRVQFGVQRYLELPAVVSSGEAALIFLTESVVDNAFRGDVVGFPPVPSHWPLNSGSIESRWGSSGRVRWGYDTTELEVPHVASLNNSDPWTARLNGVVIHTDSVGASWRPAPWYIGRGKNLYYGGWIATIVVIQNPTAERIRKAEGWLAHKGAAKGIPQPLQGLPTTHPYKTQPPTTL